MLAHPIGAAEHVIRQEPDGRVSLCCRGEIAVAIGDVGAPIAVMTNAVAFDDEPSVDEQIHASDAVDSHLQFDVASEPPQNQPDERFRTRFAPGVQHAEQDAVPRREKIEDRPDRGLVHESEVPRAVERRNRRPGSLTPDGLRERFDDRSDGGVRWCGGGSPVADDASLRRRQSCRVALELHVRVRRIEYEDAQESQECNAIESPSAADRLDQMGMRVRRQVSVASGSQQDAGANGFREMASCHSGSQQVCAARHGRDDARWGGEKTRRGMHGSTLTHHAATRRGVRHFGEWRARIG